MNYPIFIKTAYAPYKAFEKCCASFIWIQRRQKEIFRPKNVVLVLEFGVLHFFTGLTLITLIGVCNLHFLGVV